MGVIPYLIRFDSVRKSTDETRECMPVELWAGR
jgi:hypothetical protein